MSWCKDCITEGVTRYRKTPYPGPRCTTHHRAVRAQRRQAGRERRIETIYGITEKEYQAIYSWQDGRCFICRRATGVRKRLAVDHCHESGRVRGLLCLSCNKYVLGHLRDDIAALCRAVQYLMYYPAVEAGVDVVVPDHVPDLTTNEES